MSAMCAIVLVMHRSVARELESTKSPAKLPKSRYWRLRMGGTRGVMIPLKLGEKNRSASTRSKPWGVMWSVLNL